MRITIDTTTREIIEERDGGAAARTPLYSREAFELLSRLWVKVGWSQKYSYTFSWLGRPIIQLPEDMIRMQEAIHEVKPDVILETGVAHGGSLIYYASLCKAMGRGRVIGIDIEIRPHNRRAIEAHDLAPLITLLEGDSVAPAMVDRARALIRPGERVLVSLDSDHSRAHVLAELEAYAPLATPGSYVVAQDGVMIDLADAPRGGADWGTNNPVMAVRDFLSSHPEFVAVPPPRPFSESALGPTPTHWPEAWMPGRGRAVRDCTGCRSSRVEVVLSRLGVPVHQNLVVRSLEGALAATRGDLVLARCAACGLVFNAAFDPSLLSYGGSYDNNQTLSAIFDDHLRARIERLRPFVEGDRDVVEVGCGSGSFLAALSSATGCRGHGYDVAYKGPPTANGGKVRFTAEFLTPDGAAPVADVVVCRHVIEHVQAPPAFVRTIGASVTSPRGLRLAFETPRLEWILEHGAFWDLFYEHSHYYTEMALRNVFRLAGFATTFQESMFGGQYQWLEATPAPPGSAPALEHTASHLDASLAGYAAREERALAAWRARLADLGRDGGVALWGAGAKGITLVNLVDPGRRLIRAIVDINPGKQGAYAAGTGHPIIAPDALAATGVAHAVVMNPNYLEEVRALVSRIGARVTLHPAMGDPAASGAG